MARPGNEAMNELRNESLLDGDAPDETRAEYRYEVLDMDQVRVRFWN